MFESYDKDKTFAAFESLIEYVADSDRLLRVTIQAVSQMDGLAALTEVLNKGDEVVAQAKEIERLAAHEVKNGFPLLFAHSVVALWSALESVILRFCVDWLMCFPQLLEDKAMAKVSVGARNALGADKRAIVEEIVQTLEQITRSPLKAGVGRFDVLLDAVGISVAHDEARRRSFFELSKIRNVIVHQAGRADKKLVNECPWLNVEIGDRVIVDQKRYSEYVAAVTGYAADIVRRSRKVADSVSGSAS